MKDRYSNLSASKTDLQHDGTEDEDPFPIETEVTVLSNEAEKMWKKIAQQLLIELNELKHTAHEQKDTSNQSTSTTDLQHNHEDEDSSLPIDKPRKLFHLDDGHYHLAVCTDGNILATEWSTHGISVFNCEGKKVGSLQKHELKNPCGVAVSIDDHILVTDEHRLQKLKTDGTCVKSLGSSESAGCGQLEFNHPKGIAVHPRTGLIFVTDSGNERIQVFTNDLAFCYTILYPTEDKHMQFNGIPRDTALDSKGYLYVADDGNNCVTKLTVSGEYITHFGSCGSAHGQIHGPSALTVINNLVYVTELHNHRVSVFNTEGNYLYCFGEKSGGGA